MAGPTTGDIVIWARPAAADTFAPYGRLLGLGDRVRVGQRGGVLVALDAAEPGPRRFTHLQRYPEARRVLLPLGASSMLVVVLGAGDPPPGPPAAFRIPAGQGVVLEPGVWHAGPLSLEEGALLELQETRGRVDRLDHRHLRELLGVEAVRVRLPEEPGPSEPRFHVEAPGAVLVEDGIPASLTLGLLLLDALEVELEHPALLEELDRVAAAMRELASASKDLGGVLGVGAVRALWRAMDLDPVRRPPPYEDLVRGVIDRAATSPPHTLEGALRLVAIRRQVALGAFDAVPLTVPLQFRRGRPGERLRDAAGRPVDVEGVPVLCDRDGPLSGPLGTASRVRPGPGMHRALVMLYLPATVETSVALAHLEEVSRAVRRYARGIEAGRLVLRIGA